jgi:hypothetical protein
MPQQRRPGLAHVVVLHLSPAHLCGAVERLEGLTTAPERAASAHDPAQSGRIDTVASRNDA